MKKLMIIAFLSFVGIAGVSAQACCAKKTASCAKSETTSATTQVAGDGMVRKVANTTEAAPAACAKGAKAACCSKTAGAKACAGKEGDARTTSTPAPAKKLTVSGAAEE
jgi:hypothetical protein